MTFLKTKNVPPIVFTSLRLMQLFSGIIISFFMMPFLIHHLGIHYYGIWVLVSSFTGYYGMLDFGISSATQRYVAQAIGRKDFGSINELISSALFAYSILSALILVLGILGYCFIPIIFHWNSADIQLLQKCLLITVMGVAFSFPMRAFTGMLGAALRLDISAIIEMVCAIARAGGMVYVILNDFSLVYLTIVAAVTDVLYQCLISIFAKKIYYNLKLKIKYLTRATIKKILSYSLFSFINNIANMFKYQIDNVVIGYFLNASMISVYTVAFRLYDYFSQIVISAIGFSDNYFSRHEGAKNNELLVSTFYQFSRLSTILSVFVGGSLIIYGKPFIVAWLGNELSESYKVLLFLIYPGILYALQDPLRRMFYALSKHHILAYLSIIEGLLNIILSIILVRYYGVIGVAIGTGIPSLIFNLFVIPNYGCSILKISLVDYWIKAIIIPSLKITIFVGCYGLLIHTKLLNNFCSISIFAGLQIIIFFLYAFAFILEKTEKESVIKLILRR